MCESGVAKDGLMPRSTGMCESGVAMDGLMPRSTGMWESGVDPRILYASTV
jgi:hypothetical protein